MTSRKEIEKALKRMWERRQKAFGERIPEAFRNLAESFLFPGGIYELSNVKDLEGEVPGYLNFYTLGASNNTSRLPQPLTDTKKKTPKLFERRFRLVEFVADRVLNMFNLAYQKFSPHKRIKWRPLCDEWNKAHPYDPMVPVTLKGEYYHAIAEEDIKQEYFNKKEKWIAPLRESILRFIGTGDAKKLMESKGINSLEAERILKKEIQAWIQRKKIKEVETDER